MSLTLEEVRQREREAKIAEKKARVVKNRHNVKKQWYFTLGRALEKSGSPMPDFGFELFADCHWIGGHDEDFIRSIIGNQLKEYGLELKTLTVIGGMDSAVWVCIGKPGQFDAWMR